MIKLIMRIEEELDSNRRFLGTLGIVFMLKGGAELIISDALLDAINHGMMIIAIIIGLFLQFVAKDVDIELMEGGEECSTELLNISESH